MNDTDFMIPATFHDEPSVYQKKLGKICYDNDGDLIDAVDFYQEVFPPDTIQEFKSARYVKTHKQSNGHNGNPLILIDRAANISKNNKPKWFENSDLKIKDQKAMDEDPFLYSERHSFRSKRILFNDYKWVNDWKNMKDVKHVYCGGLTYLGKKRDLAHAVSMHAMIFDVDMVSPDGLKYLFYMFSKDYDAFPHPNYIVLSGTGVHLYYVFEEPIPLFHGTYGAKIKAQVNELKRQLTKTVWNPYSIGDFEKGKKPQYQSINQAFRLVGSYTKSQTLEHDRYKVIAYKFPRVKKYEDLDEFYKYTYEEIPKENRYRSPSVFGVDYWKEKNPDWYERRIVKGDKTTKYWDISRKMYEWWLREVREKATYGHRYNCLFCTVVYAIKCNIDKKELFDDLMKLRVEFTKIKPDDPITVDDVHEAMSAYSKELNTYTIKVIEYYSGIDIPRTKRNGRTQLEHLKRMRVLRTLSNYENVGRKSKQDIVLEWRSNNPKGSKADCIKATELSKPTVYKWWDSKK